MLRLRFSREDRSRAVDGQTSSRPDCSSHAATSLPSMSTANAEPSVLPGENQEKTARKTKLLYPFDPAREQVVGGWLRIAFFFSILFNHAVRVDYEFVDGRTWLVWAQSLRDFGAVGFFLIGGVTLRRKILAANGGGVTLPINLLRLTVAAACLAAFDVIFSLAKGTEPKPLLEAFYFALYDTNLWFFVAYAFASAMLLTMDRRGIFWTGICCLLFVMFPAHTPLISPYILQTISLGFICMAIGQELHGRTAHPAIAAAVAVATYLLRVSLDDYGAAVYPAIDIVLRIVYGVACFFLLKTLADRLSHRFRPPGWSNYLFVPYIIQFPLVVVVTVFSTAVFTQSLQVNMPPIFLTFGESLGFRLFVFAVSLVASFVVAWVLRRYRIRV